MPVPTARPHLPKGRIARLRAKIRRLLAYLGAFAALVLLLVVSSGNAAAASPSPPAPEASAERVYDTAGLFSTAAAENARNLIAQTEEVTDGEVFVFAQVKRADAATTTADARALLTQWATGGESGTALVMLWNADPSGSPPQVQIALGAGYRHFLPEDERVNVIEDSMASYLADHNYDSALTAGLSRINLDAQVIAGGGSVGISAGPSGGSGGQTVTPAPTRATATTPRPTSTTQPSPTARPEVPAGPPFPPPVTGRRVYDQADALADDTVARLQVTADRIEERTGAQIVVYTQVKPGVSAARAEQDAIALIDQWGIGRRGFDDGLVILFDLDNSLKHGQVQLYAAPGFRAAFLSNAERQAIYERDMLPYLRQGDLDGAVLIAMAQVDAAATVSHAQSLQFARQLNAVVGLAGGSLVFLLLGGWVVLAWFRHGRDPHYLDDPSIYVAGPPVDLTPASGAFILEGSASRRALTSTMLDLASRGEVSFREDEMGMYGSVGLAVGGQVDPGSAAIANARPLGMAETAALEDLRVLAIGEPDGYLDPKTLRGFGLKVGNFNAVLERQVIGHGWYAEAPRVSRNRWLGRGILEIFAGIVVFFIASLLTFSGLTLVAAALIAAGILTFILAFSMPAKTMAGAMVEAMLLGYRRTLAKTMATARSMNQVVAEAQLPWLRTPDQAMVWATALGLQPEIDAVMRRSLEDLNTDPRAASNLYFPTWYAPAAGLGAASVGSSVAEGRGGLFSNSVVPNFGSMLAALGTIGNSPVSTSSGSSGGSSFSSGGSFGGGSSGGGGGGAGGGF